MISNSWAICKCTPKCCQYLHKLALLLQNTPQENGRSIMLIVSAFTCVKLAWRNGSHHHATWRRCLYHYKCYAKIFFCKFCKLLQFLATFDFILRVWTPYMQSYYFTNIIWFITPLMGGIWSIVTGMSACLSVHSHTRKPHSWTSHFVHVACGHDSVLFWRRWDKLCTSGLTDDVIISHNGPYGASCTF